MRAAPNHLVPTPAAPSEDQRRWLQNGLRQPGGKLPLYDDKGQRIAEDLVTACIAAGWAEPWVKNPVATVSRICRLTGNGKSALTQEGVIRVDFTQWKRDTSSESLVIGPSATPATPTIAPTASGLLYRESAGQRRL